LPCGDASVFRDEGDGKSGTLKLGILGGQEGRENSEEKYDSHDLFLQYVAMWVGHFTKRGF
jgi:hypothetical protein